MKRRILVVDDDSDLLRVSVRVLTVHGYDVISAPDCATALERLEAEGEAIDLLLTDVCLPGMQGDELAERLSVERPTLKVLVTSGKPASVMRGAAQGDGRAAAATWHFIEKPYAMSDLARRVQELLEADPPAH